MIFSKSGYIKLLNNLKINYSFVYARDWKKYSTKKNKIILRHDIDFDTSYALEMAKIEYDNKIKSTFFFLMRDDYYDLYSNETYNNIEKIKNYGHKIGIHINPDSYKLYKKKVKIINSDIKYFQSFYNIKIDSISYHQPSVYNFKDIEFKSKFSSYSQDIMSKYKYFSDSSMNFRDKEFNDFIKSQKNIQLLIHPIWWMINKKSINQKIKSLFKKKKSDLIKIFKKYDTVIKIKNSYK
jgi:hypothetical protein|tara:strand:+ start:149 stop:862 length:714 start_codon:yes stop_codon:yes gene_type:complete